MGDLLQNGLGICMPILTEAQKITTLNSTLLLSVASVNSRQGSLSAVAPTLQGTGWTCSNCLSSTGSRHICGHWSQQNTACSPWEAAVSSAIATCHFLLGIASTSSVAKEGHVLL